MGNQTQVCRPVLEQVERADPKHLDLNQRLLRDRMLHDLRQCKRASVGMYGDVWLLQRPGFPRIKVRYACGNDDQGNVEVVRHTIVRHDTISSPTEVTETLRIPSESRQSSDEYPKRVRGIEKSNVVKNVGHQSLSG